MPHKKQNAKAAQLSPPSLWGISPAYQNYYHQAVMVAHGGFGYDMCNSYNEFLLTCQNLIQNRFRIVLEHMVELTDVEHVNGPRHIVVTVDFSDIEYEKGPYLNDPENINKFAPIDKNCPYAPKTPKWCLHHKQSYVIPVTFKITVTCTIDGIKTPITSQCRASIGSFPIMLFSSACVMTPFDPKSKPTEKEFIQIFRDADLYDSRFLYEYDMGLYLVNGQPYAPIVEKDMLRDQLFHNLRMTKINNNQHLLILNSNILCNSPQSNSINLLMTWKQDIATGYMSMTLTLKNPPFDTCPFNFFVLFYMFGVVRDGDILQLILDQLPPDMVSVGIYHLSKAIFRRTMYGVTYNSFAEMAVQYMNERAAVTERLNRLIAESVPAHHIWKTLRSRVLTHIVGQTRSTMIIEMLRSIVAKTFIEFHNHVIGQDPTIIKNRLNQSRLDFRQSQVLTPNEANQRRLTQTFYQNVHLPIFNGVKHAFGHVKTLREIENLLQASRLANYIRQQDLTNQNTAAAITRRDIRQRRLISENKINISIPKNIGGILKTATQVQKFREFNSESGNMMMRKPLSDAIVVLDSVNISENNPGHKQVLTLHTRMSESIERDPLRQIISQLPLLCTHPGHYTVTVNGIKVGNVCEPVSLFTEVGHLRRTQTINRFVGRYVSINDREVVINGVGGMLATLMICVYNNMQDHIKKNVPFESYIRLEPYDIKALHDQDISLNELVSAGKLEYITAMETGCLLICPSIEELWRRRNDPTYQPQYVVPVMTMFSYSTLGLISIENLPVTRATYYTSQTTHTVEYDCFLNTKRKKNGILMSGAYPVEDNIVQNTAPSNITYMLAMYTTKPQAQEDGSVINSHVLDFLMHCYLYDTITQLLKTTSQTIVKPSMAEELGLDPLPDYIGPNGLPKIGTRLTKGCVMYFVRNGALRPIMPSKNITVTEINYIHNQPAHVIGAYIITKPIQVIQVVIETITKMYQSSSNKATDKPGSKTVISACVPPYLLPYTQNGIAPSIVISMSTHVNRNIYINTQLIGYWTAINECANLESQPFAAYKYMPVPHDVQKRWGMDEYAMCRLINEFGTLQENKTQVLFVGMSTIQKWGVVDEYATSNANIEALTGQAQPGGRRTKGGFRLGPMEVGQLANTGAAGILRETMMDRRVEYVCRICQVPVIMLNHLNGICRICSGNDLMQIHTSHTAQMVKRRLAGANINFQWVLDKYNDYEYIEHAYYQPSWKIKDVN